jgi:predicted amidophosphoribosyltransferase
MAAMQCPDCGKWVPDYSDECWTCGYEFDSDECECECSCDYDYSSSYSSSYRKSYGAKQCVCGKWVPSYAKQCWTCRHYFY